MSALADNRPSEPDDHLSRRQLLVAGAAGAAVGAGIGTGLAEAKAERYPRLQVIQLSKLKKNRPVSFNYPLAKQPNVLLDLGTAAPGGVGPKKSIVAYSVLCQHMGCPVEYEGAIREFVCPCHQSRYDPERLGSIIQGVAMQPLPRVLLTVRNGAVWAVGVDGLVFGYRNNLHPGTKVGGGS